jgi:hypothetical protein
VEQAEKPVCEEFLMLQKQASSLFHKIKMM